jgi:hypothetical protein
MLGGDAFGIHTDNPYWEQTVHAPNLMSQLDQAGISWKAYLQGLPYPGYRGMCYPVKCLGLPDSDTLYNSKHNGVVNFANMQTPSEFAKLTPIAQLQADLSSGDVPGLSYIVPDECTDMHGAPPFCVDSGVAGDVNDNELVATGDAFVNQTVAAIQSSSVWSKGNDAIVLTFDEGNGHATCCGVPGTGRVAEVVVTNHGPRGLRDGTPYNHYSLLSSLEHAFGVGCVAHACDRSIKPMTPLFRVTGSVGIPALPSPFTPPSSGTGEPTPQGPPVSGPGTSMACDATWHAAASPNLSVFDNVLASVSAASPTDVWAVGNYYAPGNPNVLRTFGEHFDGRHWSAVALPDAGVNENTLLGVSALPTGEAWAVGYFADQHFAVHGLVEHEVGGSWSIVPAQRPGALRDDLFSVSAISRDDVWAVGVQEDASGTLHSLAEHWNGHAWSVVPTLDPGAGGDLLYAVHAAAPNSVFAVGQSSGSAFPSHALVEHWDGARWSVVATPFSAQASFQLYGVAAPPMAAGLSAVGTSETDRVDQATLALRASPGPLSVASTPNVTSHENDLYAAVTAADGTTWATGWAVVNAVAVTHKTLIEHFSGGKWQAVASPDPGSSDNGLTAVTAVPGGGMWAVGEQTNGGNPRTLVAYTC